ncbi:MAG: hypothetical protein ACRD2T_09740, partial [Thermoanaerobaculia bacterium]
MAIVLPEQRLNSGVDPQERSIVDGEPFGGGAIEEGLRFRVEAYAVDAFGNVNFNERGGAVLATEGVLRRELPGAEFELGQRFGALISGAGAGEKLPGDKAELSLQFDLEGGAPLAAAVDLTGQEGGAAIAEAIQSQVRAQAGSDLQRSRFEAAFLGEFSRYLLVNGSEAEPDRTSTVAATATAVAPLRLAVEQGASAHPGVFLADPDLDDPAGAQPKIAFSRGIAHFSISEPRGGGGFRTLFAVRRDAEGAEVVHPSDSYAVVPSSLVIKKVELFDQDGNGSCDQAVIQFSAPLRDDRPLASPSGFTLELAAGLVITHPTTVSATVPLALSPERSDVSISFPPGIPTTGLDDVTFRIARGTVFYRERGPTVIGPVAIDDSTLGPEGGRVLVDRAPPVILGAVYDDTDGDGLSDQIVIAFSEPIHSRAGSGFAAGNPIANPESVAVDPGDTFLTQVDGRPDPDGLTVDFSARSVGATAVALVLDHLLSRAEPSGHGAMAPEVSFEPLPGGTGRFLLRGGQGAGRSVKVLGGTAALKLGFDGTHIERQGT